MGRDVLHLRSVVVLVCLGLAGVGAGPETMAMEPDGARDSREPIWEETAREATGLLQSLLRQPGVNPPGDELEAAKFLADRLEAEGISAIVEESAPGRGNVMARLEGDGSLPPIILLCHLDVVPVERESWTVDPFEGVVKDGVLYGRGAIDDRGMCVVNLLAFFELKRQAVPLARDVVYLATADEEVDGTGVSYMLEKHPEELKAEYVINEGGIGLEGAVIPGQVLFAVSTGEKGIATLRLLARGEPGHGSIPKPDQAPARLVQALAHLASMEPEMVFHEQVREVVTRVGATQKGFTGFLMRHPGLFKRLLVKELGKSPTARATMSNTINPTIIRTGVKVNVVPGEAEALLDCRVLPGTTPQAWRDRIQAELRQFDVEVELVHASPATTSPWDTDLFRGLERHLPDGDSSIVVSPVLSTGYTDSRPFRERGVIAYGVVPFVVTQAELEGMHGHDEGVKTSELGAGVRRLYRTLVDVAAGQ